jgi:hypothetical protein
MADLKTGAERVSYRIGVVDGAVILKIPYGAQDITMAFDREAAIALGKSLLTTALSIEKTKKE